MIHIFIVMSKNNSLKTGKFIAEKLKDIVPLFPVIADHGTKYPFAVFRRTGLTTYTTKNISNYTEHVLMLISIASTNYDESIELADKVKTALEHLKGVVDGIYVEGIDTIDANEDWQNDAFIQNLTFRIRVTK